MTLDVICEEDLDLYGRETDDAIAVLEQDLWHRLLEEPGENLDDPDRGCGLRDILSSDFDAEGIRQRIVADFKKDVRVDTVTVAITDEGNGLFRIVISIGAIGKELGIVAEINTVEGTIILLDA